MKMKCSRCGMDGFGPVVCPACLGPIETIPEDENTAVSREPNSGGGFWTAFFILCGLGLLMQVSALFL